MKIIIKLYLIFFCTNALFAQSDSLSYQILSEYHQYENDILIQVKERLLNYPDFFPDDKMAKRYILNKDVDKLGFLIVPYCQFTIKDIKDTILIGKVSSLKLMPHTFPERIYVFKNKKRKKFIGILREFIWEDVSDSRDDRAGHRWDKQTIRHYLKQSDVSLLFAIKCISHGAWCIKGDKIYFFSNHLEKYDIKSFFEKYSLSEDYFECIKYYFDK